MENQTGASNAYQTEEVKQFLSKGFLPLIKKVLFNPTDLSGELQQRDSMVKSAVLIVVCTVLYILLPYLFAGQARSYIGFGFFLRMGLVVLVALVLISAIASLIKLLYKKQAVFREDLLTGGLCAVPLMVLLIFYCILSLFGSRMSLGMDIFFTGNYFVSLVAVYCFLLIINIFYQALRSANIKANTAWYLSPLSIMLAFYLAFRIINLF